MVSFPQVSPLKPCMHLSCPPYVPHVLPIFPCQALDLNPSVTLHIRLSHIICVALLAAGLVSSVPRLAADRSKRVLSVPLHTRLGAYPAPCTTGNGYFSSEVKRLARGIEHLPPSSAEIKERIELYLRPRLWFHDILSGELYLFTLFSSSSKIHSLFTYPN